MRAFLARDAKGLIFLYYPHPPIKIEMGWYRASIKDTLSSIDKNLFPEVKWEDKEPTEIDIQIVTKSLDSSQLPQQQLTK